MLFNVRSKDDIYRTETTTKQCRPKTEKVKTDMLRSNSKSLKNKKKGCSGKDLQKRKMLSLE